MLNSPQLALQMLSQLRNRGEVEQLREIHQSRVVMIDPLMNFNELQRAGPYLEQIVIQADALTLHRGVDDRLQFVLDLTQRSRLGRPAALGLAQGRELLQLGIELLVEIALFQQVALDFAARG